MKYIILSTLLGLSIFLVNCDSDDCEAIPSCLEPNVNDLNQLRIDLSRFSEEEIDDSRLVRFDRFNQEVIDTLTLSNFNQFENEIILGQNSTLLLSRQPEVNDGMPDINFRVLIGSPVQEFDITDINIVFRTRECSCPEVLLESLRFNGDLFEINNTAFVISL